MRPEHDPSTAWQLVLTCEHASRFVPERYQELFEQHEELLASHRGWDPGALELAEVIARELDAPLIAGGITRLLVDLNRSLHDEGLHSDLAWRLPASAREDLLRRFYRPHRAAVLELIESRLGRDGAVVHVGVHSFTPIWESAPREVELGLLFDPGRPRELELCTLWKDELEAALPGCVVRHNEPYLGTSDGLTTSLRGRLPEERYLGIELELSQKWLGTPELPSLERTVAGTLSASLALLGR